MKKPLKLKVMELLLELDRGSGSVIKKKARSPSDHPDHQVVAPKDRSLRFRDVHVGKLVIKVNQPVNSAQLIKEIDRITAALPELDRAKARKALLKCI